MEHIQPFFKDEITCVFATDDNYALFLGVTIQSIISNASITNNYGIYILEEDLQEKYKRMLLKLVRTNIKITFINTKKILSKYPQDIFYTHGHFSKATYYRFFIPDIFINFKKIIYLDCDLIINTDISELYNQNLHNNSVGCINSAIYKAEQGKNYIKTLGLKDPKKYFNAGVIVFDVIKLNNINFTQKCIETLESHKNLKLLDQDVLNIVLEDNIQFLDRDWNIFNNCLFSSFMDCNRNEENEAEYKQLEEKSIKPKIMHYTSNLKPWNSLSLINAHFWWKYAELTPFYEIILFKIFDKKRYDKKTLLSLIFSIKNEYKHNMKHKVITILGIKLKFKCKS